MSQALVPCTLAQSRGASAAIDAVVVLGALIVLVVLGGLVVIRIRRRFMEPEAGAQPALLMDDLRALRDRGEISEEEYQRTRSVLIERLSAGTRADADAPPRAHRAPRQPDAGPAPTRPPGTSGGQTDADAPRVARPGYDLTGAPLPPRSDPPDDEPPGTDSPPSHGER